jgi:hypothetical protein
MTDQEESREQTNPSTDYEFKTGTSEIVCVECETAPRLKSLDKNDGTQLMCDCDDVRKSMDSVPYELGVSHLPDDWVVIGDGRAPKQMAREVDALWEAGEYECPGCGAETGLMSGVSCSECGYVPEEYRA